MPSRKQLFSIAFFLLHFFVILTKSAEVLPYAVFEYKAQGIGHRLVKSLVKETAGLSAMDCTQECLKEGCHCKSVNYGFSSKKCQLNSQIAFENSSNLERDKEFTYIEKKKHEYCQAKPKEPQSCSTIRTLHPSSPSGSYRIKPGGPSSFKVYCNMTSKNGIGVTVIGHDSGARTTVQGYEEAGSYQRKLTYDVNLRQIDGLIKVSLYCEQFVKYECYHAVFFFGPTNRRYTWWVSRQGAQMNYWGGAAVNSSKCACGMTGSCAGGKNCNCDNNDKVWREDHGFLKDKNTLPVTEIRVGDTGTSYEQSNYTIGKLRCWGP